MNQSIRILPTTEAEAESIANRLRELQNASIEISEGNSFRLMSIIWEWSMTNGEFHITFGPGIIELLVPTLDGRELLAAAGIAAKKEAETALTLLEKEQRLRATVAMPTANDWRLLLEDDVQVDLVARLNAALVESLDEAKSGKAATYGEIGKSIYDRLTAIENDYPNAGISDSEGNITVARFFAVNFSPAAYDYLRYYRAK